MEQEPSQPPSPEVVARLVASHREFLAFLDRRLGSRDEAEEVLQAAFARTLERGGSLREPESAVAWFYRLLRNALTDHYRKRAAAGRALERRAQEPPDSEDESLRGVVCQCMATLLPNLKHEYAEVLRRVELEEVPLAEVADALAITRNNAAVRLHRARAALRRELERSCGSCATHGCLDCTCGASASCH